MAKSNEQKAIDDLNALAPEFAKLTQDFLFGYIRKRCRMICLISQL